MSTLRFHIALITILLSSLAFGQCDPIDYNVFYSSTTTFVPPGLEGDDIQCYSITQNAEFQLGAIWSTETIDLDNSFEYSYYVNLGSNDANGADGIVFVLSGDPLGDGAIGEPGHFLSYGGVGGISPSVALEFDTWNNGALTADIFNDHAMLHYNGVMDGSAGPAIDLGNIEDGEYHLVEVIWDSPDEQLIILFDDIVLVDEQIDLINDIFGGTSEVLIGFTGSTGGSFNFQTICDVQVIYTEECNGLDDDCDGLIDEDTEVVVDQNIFFCEGGSLTVGTSEYTESGSYVDILSTVLGCDSIVNTNLTVGEVITYVDEVSICQGEEHVVGASIYTEEGIYMDVFQTVTGCDSIIETHLEVNATYEIDQVVDVCEGDSYEIGGEILTAAGNYTHVLQTAAGCDSTVNTEVIIRPNSYASIDAELCEGEVYETALGAEYSESGAYQEVFTIAYGCEGVVDYFVEVTPRVYAEQTRAICSGGQVQVGSSLYTQAGTYQDTLVSSLGCDSVITTTVLVITEFDYPDSLMCDGDVLYIDMNPFPVHEMSDFDSFDMGIYGFSTSSTVSVIADLDGCLLEDEFQLQFLPVFESGLYELNLCDGEPLELPGRDAVDDFTWSTGEETHSIVVQEAGIYVKDFDYYCGNFQDRFFVEEKTCNCSVFVPNSFTPNDDGINDHFGPVYSCDFDFFELSIYDRDGRVIFKTDNPDKGWNGGGETGYYVSPGIYAYELEYRNFKTEPPVIERMLGKVTVVR